MADVGVQAPMHKNSKTTMPRISNFYTSTRFKDTNLVGRLFPKSTPVTSITHWALPGGEGAWTSWNFSDIIAQSFTPSSIGDSFGPTWSTHWFKIEFTIPEEWFQEEVRFRWVSGTEATLWSESGEVLQGLSTGTASQLRTEYILTHSYPGGAGPKVLYVEMACNKMFGASNGDQIDPPDPNMYFTLQICELVVINKDVYKLVHDLEVLYELADTLSTDPIGYMAMHSANQMVNLILAGKDVEASAVADQYFAKKNGERVHTLAAIGNCHIDSAWLWPFSETKRKVARSYSSQLVLMKDYPEYIFVASQAQQWAWCKEYYPSLFNAIKTKVADGHFLPVGTTWTEMDGNIPSGESFIRQFFLGNKFYEAELGFTCKEFWLPDTFGYNGQIPALMRHVGLGRFLTQKMSWSLVNKFPNHNFTWEGIDGSTILAHFPPGDTYGMRVHVEECVRTETNLLDKGRVSTSAFLYGYGDGGGGPTQEMLERRQRLANTDGCPKLTPTTPDAMFTQLESEQHNMMRWVGELFLEMHNGTYTSQAYMKQLCRLTEFRLRDAEFLLSSAVATKGAAAGTLLAESMVSLETAWKKVLLNQFHDVLPGSGIGLIYEDAKKLYDEAIFAADVVLLKSSEVLFGTSSDNTLTVLNTLQWPRREVVEITSAEKSFKMLKGKSQMTRASTYALVDAIKFGYNEIVLLDPVTPVTVVESNGNFTMTNGMISAQISSTGQLISLKVVGNDRDLLQKDGEQKYGNQITLYDDEPLYWDAWDVMDYHLETGNVLNNTSSGNVTSSVAIVETGPLVGRLIWSMNISDKSTFSQEIVLTADCPYLTFVTNVDWHESHKMLKTNFDSNLLVRNATYEIQFGHIQRPTNMNTSWDSARYEVCGHKWADIAEPNIGMAILNDSKYGWEGRGNTLTLSLLKSPKAPDFDCDMRSHNFKYAVMPHAGTLQEAQVMRVGYEFNNPLRFLSVPTATVAANPAMSMFDVQGSGIMLHTIKPADDVSGDIILRLFEGDGCRSTATITTQFKCSAVKVCDGLEKPGIDIPYIDTQTSATFDVTLDPFKIFAIRLSL